MINSKILSALAPWVTFSIVILAIWKWFLARQLGSDSFNIGFLTGFLPVVWIGLAIKKQRGQINQTSFQMLTSSISLAGFMLGVPLALSILQDYQIIHGIISDRLSAMFMGAFIIIIGNALPKTLAPMEESQCSSISEQGLKRFGGWMFVIGGLGYALIWLFLPIPVAKVWAMPMLALPLFLFFIRVFMVRFSNNLT